MNATLHAIWQKPSRGVVSFVEEPVVPIPAQRRVTEFMKSKGFVNVVPRFDAKGKKTNVYYNAAALFLLRRHNGEIEILLFRDKKNGTWGPPAGGKKARDDDVGRNTALREYSEESGNAAPSLAKEKHFLWSGRVALTYIVLARAASTIETTLGNASMPDGEVDRIKWFNVRRVIADMHFIRKDARASLYDLQDAIYDFMH